MTLDITRASALAALPHGFLGRTGGVSQGIFASLNVGLGSSDDREAVRENRARAVAAALTETVTKGSRFDAMDTHFLYPGGVVPFGP